MTLLGTGKRRRRRPTPRALHVEPRADANGPNCLDCIPLPHGRSGTPGVAITKTYSPEKHPMEKCSGQSSRAIARQTRAFDAACSDGSLRRRSGRGSLVQIHSCDFRGRSGCRHVVSPGRAHRGAVRRHRRCRAFRRAPRARVRHHRAIDAVPLAAVRRPGEGTDTGIAARLPRAAGAAEGRHLHGRRDHDARRAGPAAAASPAWW